MLDPRALRTFLAVCRESSISGAARRLHISQPSISVSIAQLEHAIGAALLERSRAGITLTPAGEALRRHAEAMESILEDAKAEVALVREGLHGPLRVGGTPGALSSLLPDAVSVLDQSGIRFSLHILERSELALADMLRQREIEIAFVTTGIEEPPADIEEKSFARDPFDLIVGRSHDELPAEINLRDAIDLRWVLPEAAGAFRRQIDALFIAAELQTPRDVIRCDSLLTTKAIVRGGNRVTVLPRRVAAAELSIGVLRAVKILDTKIVRQVGVRTLRNTKLSPLARQLLQAISLDQP